jgi:hypothetical protein
MGTREFGVIVERWEQEMRNAVSSQAAQIVHRSDKTEHSTMFVTINHYSVKESFAPTITQL